MGLFVEERGCGASPRRLEAKAGFFLQWSKTWGLRSNSRGYRLGARLEMLLVAVQDAAGRRVGAGAVTWP